VVAVFVYNHHGLITENSLRKQKQALSSLPLISERVTGIEALEKAHPQVFYVYIFWNL
jgi:hypothetical protein